MRSHIEDGDKELKKPVMFTEFGLSSQNKGFNPAQRDRFYKIVFDLIYKSAKKKGSGAGSFAWQFFVGGMEEYNDEFGIVPWERPSTYKLIIEQSCRLARVEGFPWRSESIKQLCSHWSQVKDVISRMKKVNNVCGLSSPKEKVMLVINLVPLLHI